MGDPTTARTSLAHVRRGVLARLLGVLVLVPAVLLGTAAPALAADLTSLSVSAEEAGQPGYLTATLSGTDCTGVLVTLAFVGGESKQVSALPLVDTDGCTAGAALRVPVPDVCSQGEGLVTATATLDTGATTSTSDTVDCPTVEPSDTAKPSNPPSPKPSATRSDPGSPTATAPSTATASADAGPSPTRPAADPQPIPEQPEVARQAALLVPVDDGGPQPPVPQPGTSPRQVLVALAVLAMGGLVTALAWRLGATRAVIGGVVAGTLALASAPLVLPMVTTSTPPESTSVRLRTVTAEQELSAGRTGSAFAHCPAGSQVVGGGMSTSGSGAIADVSASHPTANGWTATATASSGTVTVSAIARCSTDQGLVTMSVTGLPATLSAGDTARTTARCVGSRPLAIGWSGSHAPAVAGLPLAEGATTISWGTQDDATSATDLLCATAASTAWPLRYDSDQVEIVRGAEGHAVAACADGSQAVGGGYVAAASVGGRVAPVTVVTAAPSDSGFDVKVVAEDLSGGVLLTAYALCVPVY